MKYAFLAVFLVLAAASALTAWSMPSARSRDPVLLWVTDKNPARAEQIAGFKAWLARTNAPPYEMLVDSANRDHTKQIVQGVSGVGGDVMDLWTGADMTQFQSMGLLQDLTDVAVAHGFDLSKTYPALAPEISIRQLDGTRRQYQFPCNVVPNLFVVNKDTFAKYDQPLPTKRWTIEDFERRGKAFVAAANAPSPDGATRPRVYFADGVDSKVLRRTLGGSELNETLTASAIDTPASAEALWLQYKWTYVDGLIPSGADLSAASTNSGYGGAVAQLFNEGRIGMMYTGRNMWIQFRQFNVDRVAKGQTPLRLGVVEAPYEVFPNTALGTRDAAVYAGGKHKEGAMLFLQYLASADYNDQIVRDADGLPPNPEFTHSEAFLHPAADPSRGIYPESEWEIHQGFVDAAFDIAVGNGYSPFLPNATLARIVTNASDEVMNGLAEPAAAVASAARQIDAEIARSLAEAPALRPQYDLLCARQRQIDALKARGEPIPAAWIENPFHLAYYKFIGKLAP